MISANRASKIIFEKDNEKRNELIDKLTEEDAKYLLKRCFETFAKSKGIEFEFDK